MPQPALSVHLTRCIPRTSPSHPPPPPPPSPAGPRLPPSVPLRRAAMYTAVKGYTALAARGPHGQRSSRPEPGPQGGLSGPLKRRRGSAFHLFVLKSASGLRSLRVRISTSQTTCVTSLSLTIIYAPLFAEFCLVCVAGTMAGSTGSLTGVGGLQTKHLAE